MKRLLVSALLSLLCTTSHAEWTATSQTADKTEMLYLDYATHRRSGGIVTIWELNNFTSAQKTYDGKSYLSSKALIQYNCILKEFRATYLVDYEKGMGIGNVVKSSDGANNKFSPAVPGSTGMVQLEAACSYKP